MDPGSFVSTVRDIVRRVRPFFVHACGYSLVSNLLLIVPSIFFLQVFDRVLTSRSNETLLMLTVMAIGCLYAMALLDVRRSRLIVSGAVVLERIAGPRVLAKMLDEAAQPSGAENVHAMRDLATLRAFLTGPGLIALFDIPWLPVYILVIFLFDPLLGAVAMAGTIILLAVARLNEKLSRKPVEELQAASRKAARVAELSMRNAEVISGLGMLRGLSSVWAAHNRGVFQLLLVVGCTGGTFVSWTKFARQAIQLAMMATGAYLVINLHTTAGVMIATTILLGRALAPVEGIVSAWKGLVEAHGAGRRLVRMLSADMTLSRVTELPNPIGAVSVDRLVFGVRGHESAIIKGVSFAIAAGESLAVIGPSASGKSTLARLLLGIWRPSSGTVRLDGADITEWPRESLAAYVGYLPQDVELFSATVSENIARMGEVNDAAVIEAAQRAGAHDMILRLPHGYDTQIAEAGSILSGGQRQRIGLARALYGNPRLVVLDEPNANLDAEGEMALLTAMAELKLTGATLIIVTHRPSMLGQIDKMLLLRDGRVELFGSRAEVISRVGPAVAPVKLADTVKSADTVRLQTQV